MSKPIIKLNASSLRESACWRRWWMTVMDGYRQELMPNDVEYGSAFHTFIATAKKTGELLLGQKAAKDYMKKPMIVKPKKKYMTTEHLLATCFEYWDKYGDGKDEHETITHNGKLLVELEFSIPYYQDSHCEILLEGTIDDLCKTKRGGYAIRDYKTTTVSDTGDYLRGYELSTQLMFYRKAIMWYGATYPDSVFAQFAATNFALFIDGVFLRGEKGEREFIRSDMLFVEPEKADEFDRMLDRTCKHISELVQAGALPDREGMINDACTTKYGRCKFFNYCSAKDSVIRAHVLKRDFIQRSYDPLAIK